MFGNIIYEATNQIFPVLGNIYYEATRALSACRNENDLILFKDGAKKLLSAQGDLWEAMHHSMHNSMHKEVRSSELAFC